jgi:hypothetical protein
MNITLEEINIRIGDLFREPMKSVKLSNGNEYTFQDIDKLLLLREILIKELNKSDANAPTSCFVKLGFSNE